MKFERQAFISALQVLGGINKQNVLTSDADGCTGGSQYSRHWQLYMLKCRWAPATAHIQLFVKPMANTTLAEMRITCTSCVPNGYYKR